MEGPFSKSFSRQMRDRFFWANLLGAAPDQSTELWKHLYLKLIVKRFQRLCHVQSELAIFVKLTAQIDFIRKTPSAQHASEVGDFMQNLFSFVIS